LKIVFATLLKHFRYCSNWSWSFFDYVEYIIFRFSFIAKRWLCCSHSRSGRSLIVCFHGELYITTSPLPFAAQRLWFLNIIYCMLHQSNHQKNSEGGKFRAASGQGPGTKCLMEARYT